MVFTGRTAHHNICTAARRNLDPWHQAWKVADVDAILGEQRNLALAEVNAQPTGHTGQNETQALPFPRPRIQNGLGGTVHEPELRAPIPPVHPEKLVLRFLRRALQQGARQVLHHKHHIIHCSQLRRQETRGVQHQERCSSSCTRLHHCRAVGVGVHPVRARRMIRGDRVLVLPSLAGWDDRCQNIIPRLYRRHMKAVDMQVGGVGMVVAVLSIRTWRGLELIGQGDGQTVAWKHSQCHPRDRAVQGTRHEADVGANEVHWAQSHLNVELTICGATHVNPLQRRARGWHVQNLLLREFRQPCRGRHIRCCSDDEAQRGHSRNAGGSMTVLP
mmetsp:Transcript_14547/g.36949  ORF Transcript_14547/g.36949 Transcript_14547/m.36949 type:complete len:331 (-) Transcript_14547:100-1092(-)